MIFKYQMKIRRISKSKQMNGINLLWGNWEEKKQTSFLLLTLSRLQLVLIKSKLDQLNDVQPLQPFSDCDSTVSIQSRSFISLFSIILFICLYRTLRYYSYGKVSTQRFNHNLSTWSISYCVCLMYKINWWFIWNLSWNDGRIHSDYRSSNKQKITWSTADNDTEW